MRVSFLQEALHVFILAIDAPICLFSFHLQIVNERVLVVELDVEALGKSLETWQGKTHVTYSRDKLYKNLVKLNACDGAYLNLAPVVHQHLTLVLDWNLRPSPWFSDLGVAEGLGRQLPDCRASLTSCCCSTRSLAKLFQYCFSVVQHPAWRSSSLYCWRHSTRAGLIDFQQLCNISLTLIFCMCFSDDRRELFMSSNLVLVFSSCSRCLISSYSIECWELSR